MKRSFRTEELDVMDIENISGKKFVMSYSCGKDSTLALHKMIDRGCMPIGLIVMINEKMGRSFFHGATLNMLKEYEKALDIPVKTVFSSGEDYHLLMEKALEEFKGAGAELACFGDIDIEGNRRWSEERCEKAGIEPVFPLWHADRRNNVSEVISLGYKCLIKSINNKLLPKSLLGRLLDEEALEVMEQRGIDVCGENGEYHTLTVDGPVFKRPVAYETGQLIDFGDYSVIDVDKEITL